MELKVMQAITEALEKGESVALVTITAACGSTPGRQGNIMAVFSDGKTIGTTGGGNLEYTLTEKALKALESGKDMEIVLDTKGIGMKCGGDVSAFVKIFKKNPSLVIVGGGHVGYEVYTLAEYLGFDVTVIDDREEFASFERFPKAKKCLAGDIGKLVEELHTDAQTYVVIATRGHSGDKEALQAIIEKETAYVGMIGSRRKVRDTLEELKKDVPEEHLKKVYAPIGLDIASREPKEIALGILAEILMVKNNGTGVPMRRVQ
jgi:xanthine dehydrogenase accessory factor